jgi:hypothetical protein
MTALKAIRENPVTFRRKAKKEPRAELEKQYGRLSFDEFMKKAKAFFNRSRFTESEQEDGTHWEEDISDQYESETE